MPATPNVQHIINEITLVTPQPITFQTYNRRRIGNKPWKRWSQHAGNEPAKGYYGNAVDIFDPRVKYNSPLLDEVHEYLVLHSDRLRIRVLLWKVASHFDHIHVDTWPMMKDSRWYRPPPKGRLVTIESDDSIHNTFDTQEPEEKKMPFLPLRKGYGIPPLEAHKSDVAALQSLLNRGYDSGLVTDGMYGPATVAAIADIWEGESGEIFYGQLFDDVIVAVAKKAVEPTEPKPHRHRLANVEGHTGYNETT